MTRHSGARALAAAAPANERAFVDALVTRYSNDPNADLKALAVRYKDAMRDLTRQYPDGPRCGHAVRGEPDGSASVASCGRAMASRQRAQTRSSRRSRP